MERLRGVFMAVFMVCWLTVIGQQGVLSSSDFHSLADSAQSSAPADNDDPSDDGTLADDFAFQSRRIELAAPRQTIPISARPVVHPPASRQATCLTRPNNWQFIQRAAATPRAPSLFA